MTTDTSWALVTGASKGIGAATALALAQTGHDVIVHYGSDAEGAEDAENVRVGPDASKQPAK